MTSFGRPRTTVCIRNFTIFSDLTSRLRHQAASGGHYEHSSGPFDGAASQLGTRVETRSSRPNKNLKVTNNESQTKKRRKIIDSNKRLKMKITQFSRCREILLDKCNTRRTSVYSFEFIILFNIKYRIFDRSNVGVSHVDMSYSQKIKCCDQIMWIVQRDEI